MAGELDTPFVPTWLDAPPGGPGTDALAPPPAWLTQAGYPANAEPLQPGIGVPSGLLEQAAATAGPGVEMTPAQVANAQGVEMSPAEVIDLPAAGQLPVVPDSISGGIAPPQIRSVSMTAPDMAMQSDPSGDLAHPMNPYGDLDGENPLANQNLSEDDTAAALRHIQQTDPYAYSKIVTDHETARQNYLAAESLRASEADRADAESNLRIQQEATAHANAKDQQLMSQAAELSTRPIDQNRWWSTRTTGQKIANIIGAIGGAMSVSGAAYAGQYGMRNQFLDDMQKQIDDDIGLQKEAITRGIEGVNQQRGIVADIYRRTGDLYQAGEVARIATLKRVQGDLLAKAQLYDPRGSHAIATVQAAQDVDARIAAAQAAARKRAFDEQKSLLDMQKTAADIAKTQAETAKKLGMGTGVGGGSYAASLENPLVAKLGPKDRERVVLAPDGKSIRLAVDKDDAKLHRDEISTAKGAIGAIDGVIADLINDPGLLGRIKAKAGLNPADLAVIRSKLALVKPQITKLASGTNRIPVAEIQAVDHAIDDPTSFTNETLKQLVAIRNGSVDEIVDKFSPQYPGFITKDSFGHAPKLAEEPDAPQVIGRLTAPAVKGDAGYAKPDAADFAGQLEFLFRKHIETNTLGADVKGQASAGGGEVAQKDYLDELDKIDAAQHDNSVKAAAEAARLLKVKNRTAAQDEELKKAKQANYVYEENRKAIDEYRKKSIDQGLSVKAANDKEDERLLNVKAYGDRL